MIFVEITFLCTLQPHQYSSKYIRKLARYKCLLYIFTINFYNTILQLTYLFKSWHTKRSHTYKNSRYSRKLFTLNRKEEVIVTGICIGYIRLTHQYLFSTTRDTLIICNHCNFFPLIILYIFCQCPLQNIHLRFPIHHHVTPVQDHPQTT